MGSAWVGGASAIAAGLCYLAWGRCTGAGKGGGWRGEIRPCTRCSLLTSNPALCLSFSYLHPAVGVSFDIKKACGKPYTFFSICRLPILTSHEWGWSQIQQQKKRWFSYSIFFHGTKKHWGSGVKFMERKKWRKHSKEKRKGKRDGNQKIKIYQRIS